MDAIIGPRSRGPGVEKAAAAGSTPERKTPDWILGGKKNTRGSDSPPAAASSQPWLCDSDGLVFRPWFSPRAARAGSGGFSLIPSSVFENVRARLVDQAYRYISPCFLSRIRYNKVIKRYQAHVELRYFRWFKIK